MTAKSVEAAVVRDLAALEEREAGIEGCSEAAAALAIARELDTTGISAASRAQCSKALAEMMKALRERAPAAAVGDRVDELASRRARRVSSAGRQRSKRRAVAK